MLHIQPRYFENWLASAPKSPAEMALKNHLRKILDR
jgi:hypothetical protein